MKPLHRYSLLFDRRHCTTISIFFKLQTNSVFENLEELLELCDAGNSDFGRQELALLRSQERRNQDASAEMVEQSVGAGPFKLPATARTSAGTFQYSGSAAPNRRCRQSR